MLEDRLSHTYSQHSIGDYRKSMPQSSNMYPPIPSELPRGQSGAESYYNINGTSHVDSYTHVRPQAEQNSYLPPQSPYSQQDRIPPTPSSHYITTPSKIQQQTYPSATQAQPAPSFQSYPQSPSSSQDIHAFHNNQYQVYQQAPPAIHQLSGGQQIGQPLHVQQSYWPQSQQQQPPPPTQQEATLPQHPQVDTQPSLSYPSMTSYTQASFPSAPQHQPLPKPVEESLIEL